LSDIAKFSLTKRQPSFLSPVAT